MQIPLTSFNSLTSFHNLDKFNEVKIVISVLVGGAEYHLLLVVAFLAPDN